MQNQCEIKQLLTLLDINKDIDKITITDVNAAFRKKAKTVHPDKAGDSKKAAFQELLNAYHKLRELFSGNTDIKDDVKDEEVFFRDNFERFNFPFENKGSFTVGIEDHLADIWQNCIESLLGEPKIT